MARYASEAERLRAHREAFTLALELGCTPREAEAELRRRKTRRRATCGTRVPEPAPAATDAVPHPAPGFGEWGTRWMMRD